MKGSDLLRIVDQMHHEKNIDREIIFEGIEAALQLAAEKKYGEESGVIVTIDRDTGDIIAKKGEEDIDPAELGPHRRPDRQAGHDPEDPRGRVQRRLRRIRGHEGRPGARHRRPARGRRRPSSSLGKTEAILPRSEQIPGETHHVGERIKAVILDVSKVGHRVKIILSRTHPDFVRRLFENEIPEIADRTIEIRALAREAGYRSKVAVSAAST